MGVVGSSHIPWITNYIYRVFESVAGISMQVAISRLSLLDDSVSLAKSLCTVCACVAPGILAALLFTSRTDVLDQTFPYVAAKTPFDNLQEYLRVFQQK